jgi:PAS domain S-box-containing protein
MAAHRRSAETTRLLRQLAESQALAHIGSWEWDVRTNTLTWTDEHYAIWGLEPGTPVDLTTVLRGIHPADRRRVARIIDKSLRDGEPYRMTFRVCPSDGSERIVEARGQLELDANGDPIRNYGTAQDITERTSIAATLKRTEERFREAVENAVEGVFRTTQDGRYVMANRALARILGYDSPQHLMSERTDVTYQHYVRPEERARFMRIVAAQQAVQAFEYEAYRRDGSRIWLREHARAVRDGDGNVYYEGTVQDVTNQRLAKELLDLRARQQAAVARLGQEAITQRDLDSLIECAADLIVETLGVEFSQVLECRGRGDLVFRAGRGWRGMQGKIIPGGAGSQAGLTLASAHPIITSDWGPELREHVASHFRDHAIESGITVIIGTVEHPFGILGAHTTARRSFTADDVNFLQGMASILAAAVVRQRADEVRGHLLARAISAQEEERTRIARELHDETGQALSAVLLGLRSVQDATSLKQVQILTERLRDLTFNAMRDVGRIARGLRPSILDDLGLVPALRRYAEELAATRDIEIAVDSDGVERLPHEMETTLYRIIQEALTNVTRHAEAHHVAVSLTRHNGGVRAVIHDDGCGLDVTTVLRASDTSTLGLIGMRERASLLDGSVTIDSQVGAGARIVVDLPLAKAP